jgi:hypothetical protein
MKIALQKCAMELNNSNQTNDLYKSKVALDVRLHHDMDIGELITPTKPVIWKSPRWHWV